MLRGTDYYAIYRGRIFREAFTGADSVGLTLPPGTQRTDFPDATEFGEGQRGPWARVPAGALERRWREVVHARWHGTEVEIRRVLPDGRAVLGYSGGPAIATQLGMEGDQYNWWTTIAPPEEIEITRIETAVLTL